MVPISDSSLQAIEYAMDALARRSDTTANNVANADVPGFRAARVSFEEQLDRAIDSGDFERVRAPAMHAAPGRPDDTGNNVNLEAEVVEMIKTNLLQDAMVEAFNFKTGLLRTVIRGS